MTLTRRNFALGLTALSGLAACSNPQLGAITTTRRAAPAGDLTAVPNAGYDAWVAAFRQRAAGYGLTAATVNTAFRSAGFLPGVITRDRNQTEFSRTLEDYLSIATSDERVSKGRAAFARHRGTLSALQGRYGVDATVIAAIWGLESFYGERRGDVSVISATSTLAYEGRRGAFFEKQLIAALKILQSGDIDESHLTGSWAGAMGHTQFIPTSYQAYAVDMDGNGKRDIWSSVPDALATAANLLAKNGWQSGRTWGYEVVLPPGRKFPSGAMSLDKWASIGVRRANGKSFPDGSQQAELKVLDGRQGPAFLVIRNFSVIKRYNNADKYALAVGLLADEIAGYGGLVQDWNRPFTKLSFVERQELQQRLSQYGYYAGKFDGKIGSGSRAAIIAFQAQAGMQQDGHPSMEVLSRLRRKQ